MQHDESIHFFGQFLVKRGLVDPSALDDALLRTARANLTLGEMARERGFLNPGQIKELHEAQASEDLAFGQLALQRGYLTQAQLDELLATQTDRHLFLGEALIQSGRLQHEDFVAALNDFSRLRSALERHNTDLVACAEDSHCLFNFLEAVEVAFRRFPRLPVRLGGICQSPGEIEHEHSFIVSLELLDGKTLSFSLSLPLIIASYLHSLPVGVEVMEREAVIVDSLWQLVDVIKRYIGNRLAKAGFTVHETRGRYFRDPEASPALGGFLLLRLETPASPFLLGYRVDPRENAPLVREDWSEEDF